MRQGHSGGERNYIARKQRELHAALPLGHPITHGGHATGNLRRATRFARCFADQIGKSFKRLMRRQHIVIGADNGQIWASALGQGGFVIPHGRIGMGLVAAGQMRAPGPCIGCSAHPLQILVAAVL